MKLQSVTSTGSVAMLMLASSVNSLWCSAKTSGGWGIDVSAPAITQQACKELNGGGMFDCYNPFKIWCCDVGPNGAPKFTEIVHRLSGSAGGYAHCT
jgi:hypothetical protein